MGIGQPLRAQPFATGSGIDHYHVRGAVPLNLTAACSGALVWNLGTPVVAY